MKTRKMIVASVAAAMALLAGFILFLTAFGESSAALRGFLDEQFGCFGGFVGILFRLGILCFGLSLLRLGWLLYPFKGRNLRNNIK